MNLLLIFEKKFDINKEALSNFLKTQNFQSIKITIYKKNIEIKERFISKPSSFNQINNSINTTENYDKVIVFSDKQYEDNYFFHTQNNIIICSFYGWEYFTNLSKSNGIIHFIINILALEIMPDSIKRETHEVEGCIYNYLWNKTDIDKGMRDTHFCEDCQNHLNNSLSNEEKRLLDEIQILMNNLSTTSLENRDILLKNNQDNTLSEEITFSASDIKITNESILISRLIKKLENHTIDLDKNSELWNNEKMSRFIESILLRLPLPALYFDVSNPKKWQIIDGLNRLNSLQEFMIKESFSLSNLEFLRKLNDKNYEDLDGSLKRVLDETAMITYQVGVQTQKAVRDSIFSRINNKRGINENR